MSESTAHYSTAKQSKAKRSRTKPRLVKIKECTLFYIATAMFWSKKLVLSTIVGKQAFLHIACGRLNGTNFNPGNLILSINTTGARTLHPSAFVSMNLSYRYTHTCAQ